MTCAKCGRKLTNVHWFNGRPYGPDCVVSVRLKADREWREENPHLVEAADEADRVAEAEAAIAERLERHGNPEYGIPCEG